MSRHYDYTDSQAIEEYAKRLEGKSLHDYFGDDLVQTFKGKGRLGQLLEERYFEYKVNNDANPDFKEAGVELKSTPMKTLKNGSYSAKERLVLNIINYMEEHDRTFRTSSFWHKNAKILLMFYLWEKEKKDIDYIFKFVRLWQFPATDLKIIKDDWNVIIDKIRNGKAHEISEGDTFYLAACMKGSTVEESQRQQPFSDIPAMQRAYSLKNKYMTYIINLCVNNEEVKIDPLEIDYVLDEWNHDSSLCESFEEYKRKRIKSESIIKDVKQYNKGESFADYVVRQFKPYFNKSYSEIEDIFKVHYTAKNKYNLITKAILGIDDVSADIAEFVKGDVEVKTIRLESTGKLKEAMSFKQIQFKEIVDEAWEESVWHEILVKKFLFVVYQKEVNSTDCKLKTVFFWNMPNDDLEVCHQVWLDTQQKIREGDYAHFIKASNNMISHVRPKAINSEDLMETPQGTFEKKKAYWLNRDYIFGIVSEHLEE